VPYIVEELHGRERVAGPPLDKDIPSPMPSCGGKEAEVRLVVVCTSVPPSVGTLVVVRQPTET
jgi:hypothetical protein